MSQSRGARLLARARLFCRIINAPLPPSCSFRAARVLLIFDGFVVEFPSVKWWSFKFLPTT
jgi:hypothetical protein